MAIFGKDRAQQGTSNGSTIIAANSQLVGNLALNDTLHVDGRIEGDIESESSVVIGEQGKVAGQIKAETIIVSGSVDGSISATRLEIIVGGCVEGDVHVVDLVIEPGGRFNGSSEILASRASEAPAAADSGSARQADVTNEASPKAERKNRSDISDDAPGNTSDRSPTTA